jgi:hypothetical protein
MTIQMHPALCLTYGQSGSGKTTDCGYSFPNALFISTRGALQSIRHTCGYEPASVDVKSIEEATACLHAFKKNGGDYDAIVVDDFSFLAEQQMATLERKFSGFTLWGKLRDITLEFRNAARYSNCHVILNAWEKSPKTRGDGSYVRGGPELSGKLPEQIPALCDLVLRCGHDPSRQPWSGVYKCEHSSQYVMKDRFGLCYSASPLPMNLGEILRMAGYEVSRHKSLPWQEEIVEDFSARLSKSTNIVADSNALFQSLTSKGIDATVARWTLRDATDRAVLRRALLNHNSTFIKTTA